MATTPTDSLIPVTLGTSMTLESVGSVSYDPRDYIYDDPTSHGGYVQGTFQFRLVEADGTTPVDPELADAPEPSTWGMIGLSLAGTALLRKKIGLAA